MKHKKLAALLFLVITAGIATAENAPATAEPNLPGKKADIQTASKTSENIVIAQFTTLGIFDPGSIGTAHYNAAKIKITSSLKGNLSGDANVSFTTISPIKKKDEHEKAPELNKDYIIFLNTQKGSTVNKTVKILPATEENIAKIKALTTAEPKK